jgi:hypothetical protein
VDEMSERDRERQRLEGVAAHSLQMAYADYLRWQPDGDWETFLDWVADESGLRISH